MELTVVVALIGLTSLAATTRFGHSTLANAGAEGFTRQVALALMQARRSTISTGDNHYLQLTTSGGYITSFALIRRASGGDEQVDQSWTAPGDVLATSADTDLEFDFEGSALASYSVAIAGPDRSWAVSVVQLTGAIEVTETTP